MTDEVEAMAARLEGWSQSLPDGSYMVTPSTTLCEAAALLRRLKQERDEAQKALTYDDVGYSAEQIRRMRNARDAARAEIERLRGENVMLRHRNEAAIAEIEKLRAAAVHYLDRTPQTNTKLSPAQQAAVDRVFDLATAAAGKIDAALNTNVPPPEPA